MAHPQGRISWNKCEYKRMSLRWVKEVGPQPQSDSEWLRDNFCLSSTHTLPHGIFEGHEVQDNFCSQEPYGTTQNFHPKCVSPPQTFFGIFEGHEIQDNFCSQEPFGTTQNIHPKCVSPPQTFFGLL